MATDRREPGGQDPAVIHSASGLPETGSGPDLNETGGCDTVQAVVRVVSVEDGMAVVEGGGQASCGACSHSDNCGSATLAAFAGGQRAFHIAIENSFEAEVGEMVLVAWPAPNLIQATLRIYLLPMVAVVAGALAGDQLFGSDLLAAFLAAAAGLLALRAASLWAHRDRPVDRPVFLRRL